MAMLLLVAAPASGAAPRPRAVTTPATRTAGTPATIVAGAPATAAPSTAALAAPSQVLRVGDVHIEGKLYSPQALFILSRPEEQFGHDVVVPQVLQLQRSATLLPYRLRPEILAATQAAQDAAEDSTAGSHVPRRSP